MIRDRLAHVDRAYEQRMDTLSPVQGGVFSMGLLAIVLGQVLMAVPRVAAALQYHVWYLQSGPSTDISAIGAALCSAGVGVIATVGLYCAALYLAYGAFPHVVRGFEAKNSKKAGSSAGEQSGFGAAGKQLLGAGVVAALPSILSSAGWSLLSCVQSVQIF